MSFLFFHNPLGASTDFLSLLRLIFLEFIGGFERILVFTKANFTIIHWGVLREFFSEANLCTLPQGHWQAHVAGFVGELVFKLIFPIERFSFKTLTAPFPISLKTIMTNG